MTTYKKTGVNIDAAKKSVKKIGVLAKSTFNERVLQGIGGFSGAVDVSFLKKFEHPVLVSTIDGVGTKVKIAQLLEKWDTVGADIVNHCSNDLLALGAKPLFFVDYIAAEKLDAKKVASIVRGMSVACRKLDCPLIGGETAQMPGVYGKSETDIAGCMVGVVEKNDLVDGSKIMENNILLGLGSSGLHTNGYTLARKVLLKNKNEKKVLNELLSVHRSYSKNILDLMKTIRVNGIAHITGGGLTENIPRILPKNIGVVIDRFSWGIPKIFLKIMEQGQVGEEEMFRVFNMGIGLVLIVPAENSKKAFDFLKERKEKVFLIGKTINDPKKRVSYFG